MRVLLAAAIVLIFVSCSLKPTGLVTTSAVTLPPSVGEWRQTKVEEPKSEQGTMRVYQFEGPSRISVTTYEFSSDTVAFEAFQKRQVEPGTFPFYKGRLLVVPKGDDQASLKMFTETLQPLLP